MCIHIHSLKDLIKGIRKPTSTPPATTAAATSTPIPFPLSEKTKKLKRSHQNSFHVGVINPTGDFLFCSTYKR